MTLLDKPLWLMPKTIIVSTINWVKGFFKKKKKD